MPDVVGLPALPDYLHRTERSWKIDRSRLCPQVKNLVHDLNDPESCTLCGGVGFLPEPPKTAEQEVVGAEPLPADHPARSMREYIPGMS